MNNDIPRDYTSYKNVQMQRNSEHDKRAKAEFDKAETTTNVSVEDALKCLGSIGHAQVSMEKNSNVRKSVEQFQQNPFEIEARMDFCDSLIDEGYDIWKAMNITDRFFSVLKDEETYRN